MKCKKSIVLLALAVTLALVPVALAQAKKPLYCEKTLDMYPAGPGELYMRGLISGDIDGYFVIYHLDPLDEKTTGQVTHYRERWEIWKDDSMTDKLLSGTSTALANMRKGEFQAQGVVEWVDDEFEGGRYADLLGCKWHARGYFTLSPDPLAIVRLVDTVFRMN